MKKILGQFGDDEVNEDERQLVRRLIGQPVDLVQLGASVNRPEVATEIYLAALLAIDIDTLAEREYLRQLARALRLEHDVVQRLRALTGAPAVDQI